MSGIKLQTVAWNAVLAQTTSLARADAFAALLPTGSKIKFYSSTNTLIRTVTTGAWTRGNILNNAYVITPGTITDAASGSGTPTYAVITNPSDTEIFRCTAGVGSGVLQLQTAITNSDPITVGTFSIGYPTNDNFVFGLNSGGPSYTDPQGRVYQADIHFLGGNQQSDPVGFPSNVDITGTVDDVLYRSERWGSFTYNIPVSNATYTVVIKLAEVYSGISSGYARIFDIRINNQTAFANVNIFNAVGYTTAYDLTASNVVVTDGNIKIEFVPGPNEQPKVSAIAIFSTNGVYQPVSTNYTSEMIGAMHPNDGVSGSADPLRVLHGPGPDWGTYAPEFGRWGNGSFFGQPDYTVRIWPIPTYDSSTITVLGWGVIWEMANGTPWNSSHTENPANRRVYATTRRYNMYGYFNDTNQWERLLPQNSSMGFEDIYDGTINNPPFGTVYPDDLDNYPNPNNRTAGYSPWNPTGANSQSTVRSWHFGQNGFVVLNTRQSNLVCIANCFEARLEIFPGRNGTSADLQNATYVCHAGIDPYPVSQLSNDKRALSPVYYGNDGTEALCSGRWKRLTGNWQFFASYAMAGNEQDSVAFMTANPIPFLLVDY